MLLKNNKATSWFCNICNFADRAYMINCSDCPNFNIGRNEDWKKVSHWLYCYCRPNRWYRIYIHTCVSGGKWYR